MNADLKSADSDRREFTAFFARAQGAGTISDVVDPVVAADAVGDLWSASVIRWAAGGRRVDLATSVGPKLRLLFSGLAPKRSK